jgi:phage gp36-like protein
VGYLTIATFKAASVMPDEDIDALDARYPSFLDEQLENESAWIDARLRKRYAAPFESPYPKAVVRWLAAMVTDRAYKKRGVDPNDLQAADLVQDAKDAKAEILEAANSETGLFDLPLRADTTGSGISKGGPLAYSEQSPYVWTDQQVEVARDEDSNGSGTGG